MLKLMQGIFGVGGDLFSKTAVLCSHPDVQNMQLQSDIGLILSEDLNAIHMAEVSQ